MFRVAPLREVYSRCRRHKLTRIITVQFHNRSLVHHCSHNKMPNKSTSEKSYLTQATVSLLAAIP